AGELHLPQRPGVRHRRRELGREDAAHPGQLDRDCTTDEPRKRGLQHVFAPQTHFDLTQAPPPNTLPTRFPMVRRRARGNIQNVIEQAVVSLTPDAQIRLKELLAKEGNPQLALRVFVSGRGCSGMQYGMAFDDMRRPEDVTIDQDGVQIVIDDFSAPYIRGSEIDYVDSLMGAGFTVHNPNAVHSCSCGRSSDTADDSSGAQACGCGHQTPRCRRLREFALVTRAVLT